VESEFRDQLKRAVVELATAQEFASGWLLLSPRRNVMHLHDYTQAIQIFMHQALEIESMSWEGWITI
jgi:diadenosine tetraphosphate (Ap4A) HIT family hydrolase